MSTPIEMTTNCPSDETLAAFVDGRLAESERREVIQHVATCEICYDITSATWDYQAAEANVEIPEAAAKLAPPNVVPFRKWKPWIGGSLAAVAAALAIVFLTPVREGLFGPTIDPLVNASHSLRYRPFQSRISGDFAYKSPRPVKRSPQERDRLDLGELKMMAAAGELVEKSGDGSSPRSLHVGGVAQLFLGDYDAAILMLTKALVVSTGTDDLRGAIAASDDTRLLSDLSAAYCARGIRYSRPSDLLIASAAAQRAWANQKTAEAAWNLALALEFLGHEDKARSMWTQYLALDPESNWSTEAREHLQNLQPQP